MVIGAGWAGARAMTATSGPGISLMAELTGYAYFTEIPAVVVNVQRMGPSTGLPTRNSQGDLLSTYYLSHGDTQHPLLFPSSMDECYEMGQQAFDLAEQMQTPVFVMSELDLGMNTWMTKPFKYPDQPYARGKVLNAEALEKVESFGRYADVDGDGIPYRTLPGTRNEKAPYFTRGSGHNAQAKYSEDPGDWEAGMERIARKFEGAQQWLPAPVLTLAEKPSEIGLIHFGSTRWPMEEALDLLAEQGFQPDSLRIRSLPAHAEVEEFIAKHTHCYVVEQNRDGQMRSILAATFPDLAPRLRSICHFNGSFLDANTIVSAVLKLEKGSELAHV
jgi:2-oxoglutarate ferredoxin oxidoreductase subunit alpha